MTEVEWQESFDAIAMLTPLRASLSERKLRLIGLAWWMDAFLWRELRCEPRSVWELACGELVRLVEQVADSEQGVEELESARARLDHNPPDLRYAAYSYAHDYLTHLSSADAWSAMNGCWEAWTRNAPEDPDREDYYKHLRCDKLRDVIHYPHHPIPVDPSWLTPTVVTLAQGIYQEKAFDRMPILSDALQDVGCDNEEILNHCKQRDEHFRGCWLVDRFLGKG